MNVHIGKNVNRIFVQIPENVNENLGRHPATSGQCSNECVVSTDQVENGLLGHGTYSYAGQKLLASV
ncbi:hypothetical protein [Paraburkholderia sediminicola]|uniref:hypothetical protein n=1 Tax=Paraburkholderia sediminicola TaxID=458836 RepID=UPI00158206BE|nr:hypothetical protein [Paraburkholderia sediminicola]